MDENERQALLLRQAVCYWELQQVTAEELVEYASRFWPFGDIIEMLQQKARVR